LALLFFLFDIHKPKAPRKSLTALKNDLSIQIACEKPSLSPFAGGINSAQISDHLISMQTAAKKWDLGH